MADKQFNIDYHRLLGVNKSADEQTILRAFRQLALQHHPDKGGQEEMMKLLTMAKVTLLDPEKRAKYETNYDPDDDQNKLSADLCRLTIGHRLSDDYKVKIERWKQEYPRIHIKMRTNLLDELIEKLRQTMFGTITVFDLGAHELTNQGKSDDVMLQELKSIFAAQDFAKLAQYILTNQCRAALTKLYDDVKPTQNYELPNRHKALLQIIKASSLIMLNSNRPQQNRFKGLYDAVLYYPADECIDCVLKLINNRLTDAHKHEFLDTVIAHNILDENAVNNKFMQRLNSTPTLKSISKYENGIHRKNTEPMEKAMLYIDLCMVYGHPIVLANSLIWGARELIVHMSHSTDAAEVYALKNCVSDLCGTVLYFASKYANPISQLKYASHVFRLICKANHILASILVDLLDGRQHSNEDKEEKPLIGVHETALFEAAIHCISKSIKVSPFIDASLDMTSDVPYINLINNKLLHNYYQWNIDTYADHHPSRYLYQYMLTEGSWKGWFDETKFAEYRQKCISIMLSKFNTTESSVAKIMNAQVSYVIPTEIDQSWLKNFLFGKKFMDKIESKPMIVRCEKGWLVSGENYLNMGKMSFNSVDGLIVDMEQGTFEIIVSTDESIGPLCDGQDIDEIIIKGLSHSLFSLDQADNELDFHPFQLIRFSPKRLENSRYLATLLAADYLLKMIATNTEVSAQPPFEIKQATDGFLKALPSDLREFIMMKKRQTDFNKVHRFWIENDEIPCYEHVDDNGKRTYEFYYTPMLVKKNLMKQNSHGELVDDSDDSEDDLTDVDSDDNSDPPAKKISDEARFTRRLTQYYDLIGCHFPVLLRLRELAKLNAISSILRGIYQSREEKRSQLTPPRNAVQEIIEDIRRKITYPICTASKIDELYWKTLHANGVYDEDRVERSTRNRVKNNIQSQLKVAERELLSDIPVQLSKAMEVDNTQALRDKVRDWLVHDEQAALINYISNAIYEKQMEKLSRFGNNLNKLGVNVNAEIGINLNEGESGCKWVPATFSQLDGRRIYGGVALLPKLNAQNVKGFKGFDANADKIRSNGRGGPAAAAGGGDGHDRRNKGDGKGEKNAKKPSERDKVLEKYGHGKGWPDTPIRVGKYDYFGRPGTAYKTHQNISVKFGPSGWVKMHNPRFATRKAAEEAAARASRGRGNNEVISHPGHTKIKMHHGTANEKTKKEHHNKNYKGDKSDHFHSTDANGEKLQNKMHYLHPK